jgi:hypothetical protein
MAASTRDRDTKRRSGREIYWPIAAATKIYGGIMVALNAAGYLVAASDTAALRVAGVSDELKDNTGGANGALSLQLRRQGAENHLFLFANSTANAIVQADLGKVVYVEDDHTVARTTTNFVKAGRFMGFGGDPDGSDATKCWIEISPLSSLGWTAVATADGSDAATTQALANALKASLNKLIV